MKTLLTLSFLLLSLISFPSLGETMDDLVERDGLYYKKFSDVPFTGEIEDEYQGYMNNGKKAGRWLEFYKNGQLFSKGEYKNGKREGPWLQYYDSGQLWTEFEYKNGKEEGPWLQYYDNGQLLRKGAYKNGKEEGSWVYYTPDGTLNKQLSGVYKDGVKISD